MYKLNVHTPLECKRFDPFTWTTKENKKKRIRFVASSKIPLDCTIWKEFD